MTIQASARTRAAIIAALVAVVVLGWWQWSSSGTSGFLSTAPPSSELETRLAEVEKRLDALGIHMEMLLAQSSQPRRSGVVATGDAADKLDRERANPAALEAERDRRFAQMDTAFRAEPIDRQWAPLVKSKLQDVGLTDAILAIDAQPPTSRRIECRSRTCLMEFTFDHAADGEDWSTAYATGVGKNLRGFQSMVQQQPDGTAKLIMFGIR